MRWRQWLLPMAALLLAGCAGEAPADPASRSYGLAYQARLVPETGTAQVEIRVSQGTHVLRHLDFNAPASRFTDFHGDGDIRVTSERSQWSVPQGGGVLRFTVTMDHLRGNVHDARMTERWAVFRLGDLFPPATARGLLGAQAEVTVTFSGPEAWRFETPYGPSNKPVHVIASDRLFPRPVGWAVAGQIGVRRDRIADRRVAVAAPIGEGFRRQDTLAFLRWTLPALIQVFPEFYDRLLIVGGGQNMWRGGLSGPASLYLHPDRPLISGNATSTLLHELIHVAIGNLPGDRDDWLVEGLAEYYSLELLRRTGGISERRFQDALKDLSAWAGRDNGRLADPSTGANTAYAVLILHDLAERLDRSGLSMDDLVRCLQTDELSAAGLQRTLDAFHVAYQLPPINSVP